MPDDTHYWLSDMKGPTFYRLLPNAEHATAMDLNFLTLIASPNFSNSI